MDLPNEKLICGVPHIKVVCKGCDELIWTSARNKGKAVFCTDCGEVEPHRIYSTNDPIVHSELQYHGLYQHG